MTEAETTLTCLELKLISALENYAFGKKSLTESDRVAHDLLNEIFPGRNDAAARKLLGAR